MRDQITRPESGEPADPLDRAVDQKHHLGAPSAIGGGALGGAAAGTLLLGPLGTVLGALAGAVGGGWLSLSRSSDEPAYTEAHDEAYRRHWDSLESRAADRAFESVRPAYQLGHLAARNPDYRETGWDAVDADLERSWGNDARTRFGEWAAVRPYARAAYDQSFTPPHGDPLRSVAAPSTGSSTKGSVVGGANTGADQRGMNSGAVARAYTGSHSGGTREAHEAAAEARAGGTPRVAQASVPSTGADEPERASFSDPLPDRSHALDPSVSAENESREKAPPLPDQPI